MPRYDYKCTVCGHEVELLHGIHDPGPRFCPNCGTEGSMRKAFATPAVHYKGSGWAKKDRSSSSRPAASSGTTDGSKEAASTRNRETSEASETGSKGGRDRSADGGAERGGDGATVTSTGDATTTADAMTAGTGKGSTPKPTSDRGAA